MSNRQITLMGKPLPTKEEAKAIDRYAERMAFCLTAPVIAHPLALDTIDSKMKDRAKTERLAKLMKGEDDGLATDYEAMIYLSSASLVAPLDRTAYNVYAHLFQKIFPEQAKEIFDRQDFNLDYLADRLLLRLKRSIHDSQLKAVKEKMKK